MEEQRSNVSNIFEMEDKKPMLFDCRGEVNVKQVLFPDCSYLKSNKEALHFDLPLKSSLLTNKCKETHLFGRRWDYGSVLYKHLDVLFKMTSQELMHIEYRTIVNNTLGTNVERMDYKKRNLGISRFYCVELFLFIQDYISSLCTSKEFGWMLQEIIPALLKKLNTVQKQLKRLTDLPDYVYLHGCNALGNKCAQPSYHLLHVHLDLRWLNITLLLWLSKAKEYCYDFNCDNSFIQQSFCDLENFYDNLQQLLCELFDIIVKRYEKIEMNSLGKKSPFVCTCVQELWTLLQIISDSLYKSNRRKKFWDLISDYFNAMNGFHDNSINFNNDCNAVYSNISCTSRIICSLWALSNIAKLYQLAGCEIISCYPLLEDLLKAVGIEDLNETSMRICLIFVEQLCVDIWEPKVEPIVILWEYFQKKLNNHFYIPGAPPDSLAVVTKNSRGLLNQVKSFLNDIHSVRDSFQHFLRILGLYLLKTKDEPRNWRLIKARIFTKLSPSNIANLSQIGEYHFISLFLTLALTLGYGQVGNRMIELGTLAKSNSGGATNCIEFIKGQLAFVLVILENGGNAENAIKPVVEHVNRLSFTEHNDILRLYAEAVQDILQSYDNLTQGQHVLIDVWMAKYLSTSTNSDSAKLLSAILRVITRQKHLSTFQKPDQEFVLFIDKLWVQLEPYLSNTIVSPQISVPYEASDIAAALASLYLSTGKQEKFKNIFAIFLRNEISDIKLIRGFLCRFINYFGINHILPGYNKIIIKAWLRCCFLSDIHDNEIRELTTFISTLPDIKYLFEGSEETLASSDEPLLMFFMCLQNKFVRLEDIYEKQSLREKFLSYVDGMENWIKSLISNPRNHDQIKRLFSAVGNMFRLIAPLLYVKSKPNTILQQLIDQLLLPFSVHNPETKVHENIISAIKLNLHLFIQGLMQLSPNEDQYILRTLKELITVYIPRCTNLSNNILLSQTSFSLIGEFRTFDNKLKTFILSTVCNSFLKRKARRPTNQAIFGMTFIKEIMILHGKYENIFSDLITCTFERICDVIMYCETNHPVYKMAKDVIKLYLNSNALRINNSILDEVSGALTLLANENLAWSSRQMFDLLIFLSSEAPDIVMNFLSKLQELIKEVELKRGVGFDRTLRSGYEKVEQILNSLTKEM